MCGYIYLVEHEPVFTLGRTAKEEYVLDKTIDVLRVERGGEVTYHGPGQLVCYMVLDLVLFKKDLHWFVNRVEESIIQSISPFGLLGERIKGKTGVWVNKEKIAAIGFSTKQWVTMHGFSINVMPQALLGFSKIVPCGISDATVRCMFQQGESEPMAVADKVLESLQQVFELEMLEESD